MTCIIQKTAHFKRDEISSIVPDNQVVIDVVCDYLRVLMNNAG